MDLNLGFGLRDGNGGSAVIPWDGTTKFRPGTKPGLNILALAFDAVTPIDSSTWGNYMTSGRWSKIVAANPGYIRLAFEITPMLKTDGSDAALAPWIAIIKTAIDDCINHGFKVLFDMHVATYSGADVLYNDPALRAAYPNGALWLKAEKCWAAVGALLNGYASDQVGFDVYNETLATDHSVYGPLLQRIQTVVRAKNQRTTLVFAPCSAAVPDAFVIAGFTANMFGANSGFSCHSYIPVELVYEALAGSGYTQYISAVEFPAIEADRAPAKTRAANAINADGSLSAGQKTAMITQVNSQLDYYFNSFTAAAAISTYTYFFGSKDGLTQGSNLGKWLVDNGVNAADLHMGEFGAGTGVPATSRAAFLGFCRDWWVARGWSSALWVEDDAAFGINSGGAFIPQITAELGWTANLLTNLTDQFSGSALDSHIWQADGGGATVTGGRVEIPMTSSYFAGFSTIQTDYKLVGSEIKFQCGFSGGDSSFYLDIALRDNANVNNCLIFALEAFNVKALKRVAGVDTTLLGGVTYSAVNHAWVRIRETAGTVYFETSANGSSWTTFWSGPMPSGLSMTTVSVSFNAGAFNSQTGKAWVDNVN